MIFGHLRIYQSWNVILLSLVCTSVFPNRYSSAVCPETYLACDEGKCIHQSNVCDDIRHCYDDKDELGCECTSLGWFVCEQDRHCFFPNQRCDRIPHCQDGTDERGCFVDQVTPKIEITVAESEVTTEVSSQPSSTLKLWLLESKLLLRSTELRLPTKTSLSPASYSGFSKLQPTEAFMTLPEIYESSTEASFEFNNALMTLTEDSRTSTEVTPTSTPTVVSSSETITEIPPTETSVSLEINSSFSKLQSTDADVTLSEIYESSTEASFESNKAFMTLTEDLTTSTEVTPTSTPTVVSSSETITETPSTETSVSLESNSSFSKLQSTDADVTLSGIYESSTEASFETNKALMTLTEDLTTSTEVTPPSTPTVVSSSETITETPSTETSVPPESHSSFSKLQSTDAYMTLSEIYEVSIEASVASNNTLMTYTEASTITTEVNPALTSTLISSSEGKTVGPPTETRISPESYSGSFSYLQPVTPRPTESSMTLMRILKSSFMLKEKNKKGETIPPSNRNLKEICKCKNYATGESCIECKNSTFNLNELNKDGSRNCFCMNTRSTCKFSLMKWKRLSEEDLELKRLNTIDIGKRKKRLKYRKESSSKRINENVHFFELPKRFIGDKVTSYGGAISFHGQNIKNGTSVILTLMGNHLVIQQELRNVDYNKRLIFKLNETLWEVMSKGEQMRKSKGEQMRKSEGEQMSKSIREQMRKSKVQQIRKSKGVEIRNFEGEQMKESKGEKMEKSKSQKMKKSKGKKKRKSKREHMRKSKGKQRRKSKGEQMSNFKSEQMSKFKGEQIRKSEGEQMSKTDGEKISKSKDEQMRNSTREDLLTTLANVERAIVMAILQANQTTLLLNRSSMDYAIYDSVSGEVASEIEVCNCPKGYSGSSCQNCSPGYLKEENATNSHKLRFRCLKTFVITLTFKSPMEFTKTQYLAIEH